MVWERCLFFESCFPITDGLEEAKAWAIHVKRFREWAVFKAFIQSDKKNDLIESIDHRKLYDKIRTELKEKHLSSGKELKDFNDTLIFCKLEEYGFDFFRVLVDADKFSGYYSSTVRRPQIQICVKNTDCISDNKLIEWGEKDGFR